MRFLTTTRYATLTLALLGAGRAATPLAARATGGTAWLIVEQEEYPEGMGQIDAVAASLAGLRAVLAGHANPRPGP